jgi:hypothetical protein
MHNQSEIARLREQIRLECEALNLGLYGFSITAKHDIIANRYRSLDDHRNALSDLVGEEEATETVVTIYNKVVR